MISIKVESMNRYHYIGSIVGSVSLVDSDGINPLFDHNGNNIVDGNPYNTLEEFHDSLNHASIFAIDNFVNSIRLPSWMGTSMIDDHAKVILTLDDTFWYDDNHDTWIMTSNNLVYHIFV